MCLAEKELKPERGDEMVRVYIRLRVPEFKGSRTKTYNVQEQKEINVSVQEIKRKNSPFLHHFVPFRSTKNWVMPTHLGESESEIRSVVSDSL